jgi:hypothetical protein
MNIFRRIVHKLVRDRVLIDELIRRQGERGRDPYDTAEWRLTGMLNDAGKIIAARDGRADELRRNPALPVTPKPVCDDEQSSPQS